MPVKEGARGWGRTTPGAPVAGTNAIQTMTIGATPTGGTYTLRYLGLPTAPIAWNAVNVTLLASLQAALDAHPALGTNAVVATAGTLTAGVGTILLTFSGANHGRKVQPLIEVAVNALTPAATLGITTSTPGVDASHRGAPIGAPLIRTDTGVLHVNTGTPNAPTWTAQA